MHAKLINKLIQAVQKWKLLLLRDVECSLDVVSKWICNAALEPRSNASCDRFRFLAIHFGQESKLCKELTVTNFCCSSYKLLFSFGMELQIIFKYVLCSRFRKHISKFATAGQLTVDCAFVQSEIVIILALSFEIVVRISLEEYVKVIRQTRCKLSQLLLTTRRNHASLSCQSHLCFRTHKCVVRIANSIDRRNIDNGQITMLSNSHATSIVESSKLISAGRVDCSVCFDKIKYSL